jgi:hypothetical protein
MMMNACAQAAKDLPPPAGLTPAEIAARPAVASAPEPIRRGLLRFAALYADMDEAAVKNALPDVYAEAIDFRDTLKVIESRDALRDYFLETVAALHEMRVAIHDIAAAEEGFYLRWTMDVRFRRLAKGRTVRTIGMSHLRFDEAGLVVYHQDYWDSSEGFFEHVPVLGGLIRWVKGRLD